MNQEEFGKFIKKIRKEHNLTQKQLANKLGVTYQAVSKWENGLNLPDAYIIKEISKVFNISVDDLMDCKNKKKNNNKWILIIFIILGIFIVLFSIIRILKVDDFKFKTLSSKCSNFNISGNISYNERKSAIYINDINYCGKKNNNLYKNIECILYEKNNKTVNKISSFKSKCENITLDSFVKDVTLSVDNYKKTCKIYKDDSLYLLIKATDKNNKITSYKVPLKLNGCTKHK